jgi:hypothetical protein
LWKSLAAARHTLTLWPDRHQRWQSTDTSAGSRQAPTLYIDTHCDQLKCPLHPFSENRASEKDLTNYPYLKLTFIGNAYICHSLKYKKL